MPYAGSTWTAAKPRLSQYHATASWTSRAGTIGTTAVISAMPTALTPTAVARRTASRVAPALIRRARRSAWRRSRPSALPVDHDVRQRLELAAPRHAVEALPRPARVVERDL